MKIVDYCFDAVLKCFSLEDKYNIAEQYVVAIVTL